MDNEICFLVFVPFVLSKHVDFGCSMACIVTAKLMLLCFSTIKVWDYSQDMCIITLTGHKGPVRGLLWNTEVPYLVISGSWDSTLKVWDLRKGTCLDTIKDHGADVYGKLCYLSLYQTILCFSEGKGCLPLSQTNLAFNDPEEIAF